MSFLFILILYPAKLLLTGTNKNPAFFSRSSFASAGVPSRTWPTTTHGASIVDVSSSDERIDKQVEIPRLL
jgi:hypothetical protein